MATLSIVGTPIGNLEDVTVRALRVLGEADVIYAEDTRVTKRLCERYDIDTPLKTYAADDRPGKVEEVLEHLRAGTHVAFVSDAGTPGLSDPGAALVERVRREDDADVSIEVVPGPSALTAALSVAGVAASSFVFAGFLPHKKGRQTQLDVLAEESRTVIVYESPHRIVKTLAALAERAPERHAVLARELTKQFETVLAGSVQELTERVEDDVDQQRGEIVLILEPIQKRHRAQASEHR